MHRMTLTDRHLTLLDPDKKDACDGITTLVNAESGVGKQPLY